MSQNNNDIICAVIFDNHGVLTTSDKEGTLKKIAEFLQVPMLKLDEAWHELLHPFDLGELTTDEFLQEVLDKTGSKKELAEFKKFYFSCYDPKYEVRKLARDLSKDLKVAILANSGQAFDEQHKYCGFDKNFGDNIFISAKLKMKKPDREIFDHVLRELEVKPGEAILIDDKKEFVEGVCKAGMNAIQFKSLEQLEKDLESILKYDYV